MSHPPSDRARADQVLPPVSGPPAGRTRESDEGRRRKPGRSKSGRVRYGPRPLEAMVDAQPERALRKIQPSVESSEHLFDRHVQTLGQVARRGMEDLEVIE